MQTLSGYFERNKQDLIVSNYRILIVVSLIIIILDQVTKWIVLMNMPMYESIPIIE
jgi:hypothetical protein